MTFVAKARTFEETGMKRESAVKAAVDECIKSGILAKYLEENASEVINMLAQEWDWNKALEINARDAERATEMRVNEAWQSVVANKDAEIADKDAEIEQLRARLEKQNS